MGIFSIFSKGKNILVLGGGGARGLSNIGVLKELEKHFNFSRFPFNMVIGTSIGSLIGAAYCLGHTVSYMEKVALGFSWTGIFDIAFHSTGLVKGDRFEKFIESMIGNKGFDDMKIPFGLVTTDLNTGEEYFHTSGNLIKLIRASCSWPGIFSAVDIDGRKLVDGGVRNSIPVKFAKKERARFITAVDPGFSISGQTINNIIKALVQSVQIMGEELNSYQSKLADVVIKPSMDGVDQFDFDKAVYIIDQGQKAMRAGFGIVKTGLYLKRFF
jgi:NTE family protein